MNRLLATLVLAAVSFELIAPVASMGSDESQLPACCRANGKHKCFMRAMQPAESGVGVHQLRSVCPYSGALSLRSVAPSLSLLPRASLAFFAAVLTHPAIHSQTEARLRIAFSRSRQKRGPPSFLL